MRIKKESIKRVAEIIREMNLGHDYGDHSSGSENRLNYGDKLKGGFVLIEAGKKIGWGAAWEDGEFHLYLKPEYRKLGIGKKLCMRAVKHFPTHSFCPWNYRLRQYFKKHGLPMH